MMIAEPSIAFNNVAKTYDHTFTFSSIGSKQRERVHYFLLKYLSTSPSKILEINCGTGEDALYLASLGHSVSASDNSAEMINISEDKKSKGFYSPNLNFQQSSFNSLNKKYRNQKFDFVFSNFGGLNCVDQKELKYLSSQLYSLLNKEGKLVVVVMGTNCLWEQVYFLLKAKFSNAFRRKNKEGVMASVGDQHQKTFYYTPSEIKQIFNNYFTCEAIHPIGFFLPPSYLQPFFQKNKTLLRVFSFLEKKIHFSFLSNYADHYMAVFKSNNNSLSG